jgi:hypothetical protein
MNSITSTPIGRMVARLPVMRVKMEKTMRRTR